MDVTMMKGHTILIAKHKDIVDPLVIIQILSVPVSIEINNILHGLYSRSDTNVRIYFVTEKRLNKVSAAKRRERGEYTFSHFFKGPIIHLSAIFGSQPHQHFEDIAKNGQKDFEDFAEPLSVR